MPAQHPPGNRLVCHLARDAQALGGLVAFLERAKQQGLQQRVVRGPHLKRNAADARPFLLLLCDLPLPTSEDRDSSGDHEQDQHCQGKPPYFSCGAGLLLHPLLALGG